MNQLTTIPPLDTIRDLYRGLSMDDQLSLMTDLIQGGHRNLIRTDAFIDALIPVENAFVTAFGDLDHYAGAK